jgi:hypothetical protein
MTEWISVKDRLPEKYEWVLVYATDLANPKSYHVGHVDCIYEGGVSFEVGSHPNDYYGEQTTNCVTHWLQLPSPPKDAK